MSRVPADFAGGLLADCRMSMASVLIALPRQRAVTLCKAERQRDEMSQVTVKQTQVMFLNVFECLFNWFLGVVHLILGVAPLFCFLVSYLPFRGASMKGAATQPMIPSSGAPGAATRSIVIPISLVD